MKSLKKTLSLVLVLVMVLGMFGVASASSFTDDATIQYKEAVDVMVGIGAINGYTDGTFGPTKTITRAEAAKMVAYAVLGKSVAESLVGTSSSFKDVPASPSYSWAIPSIEYLVSVGAIAGDGQGNFNPNNNVTALELGKMLLVCLGIEGNFTGTGWDLQVGIAAQKAGLFEGRATGANALGNAANREECALYCFNALFYSPTGTGTEQIWTIIGITGGVVEYGWVTVPTVAKDSIAAAVYPTLTTTSAFIGGVSGYYWYYKSNPISGFIGDATVLASSAYGIPWAGLTTATSTYFIKYQADSAVTYYYNDVPVTADYPTGGAGLPTNTTAVQGKAATAGVIVNFIDTDNDNKYDVVSVTEKTVAQLSAAPTTKTTGSVTTVTIPGVAPVNGVDVRTVVYPTDLVKGDVVLYYTGANGVTYVERAAKLDGNVITSYVAGQSVTIGGVKHAISGLDTKPALYDTIAELQALIGQQGYSFYVDNGYNIVYTIAPDTSAVLTNTIFVPAVTSESGFSTTYKAIAVKPDGTQSIITVSKIDNGAGMVAVSGAVSTTPTATAGQLGALTFYTFTLNTDGSYNLTKQTSSMNGTTLANSPAITVGDKSFTITANKANFLAEVTATDTNWIGASSAAQPIMAHAGTVFMYYDATANTYTSVTGIANAKSYAAGGTIFVLPGAGGFASIVVAMGSSPTTATSSYDQVFVSSAADVSVDGNGVFTYSYTAVVNGEADKTITSYVQLTAGTLYFINDYTNGVANSAATTMSGVAAHTGVSGVAYAGGTFIVTGTPTSAYILNANAKIFVYDISDGSAVQINADQAAALTYTTDKVALVQASATDTSIIAVYITVA